MEKILLGIGIGVIGYHLYLKNKPKKTEEDILDTMRNKLHDYLKGLNPKISDSDIAKEVLKITNIQ